MNAATERSRMQRDSGNRGPRTERSNNGRFGKQVRKVTEDLQEFGNIAKDAAGKKLGQIHTSVSDRYEEGRDKAYQIKRSIKKYIQDRPLKTILVAAGVGMLLGRFWKRR